MAELQRDENNQPISMVKPGYEPDEDVEVIDESDVSEFGSPEETQPDEESEIVDLELSEDLNSKLEKANRRTTELEKSYKELQADYTRKAQRLAEIDKAERINFNELAKQQGEDYTKEDFTKDTIDEYGNFKDPATVAVAIGKLIDSQSERIALEKVGQVNRVTTLETQQREIFDTYGKLADQHYGGFMNELKNPNATLKQGFDFYLFNKGLLPAAKTSQQLAEEERLNKIDANNRLNGSIVGESSGGNIKGKSKGLRAIEDFFGEKMI